VVTLSLTIFGVMLAELWRPAAGWAGHQVGSFLTFGLSLLRDRPYALASFDPYGALVMGTAAFIEGVFIGVCVSILLTIWLLFGLFMRRVVRTKQEASTKRWSGKPPLLFLRVGFTIVILADLLGLMAVVSILTRAVHIAGEFRANVALLAPYMSDEARLLAESHFAQVKTRADYVQLREELKQVTAPLRIHETAW
jgi:hypothetical protein